MTKHIDICHHYIRKVVVTGKIEFKYCSIVDMSTCLFTKPLLVVKHTYCMQMLELKKFDQGECCPCDQIDLIHMLHISQLNK